MKLILLLDDNELHLEALQGVLEGAGYSVVSCLNVGAAVAALNQNKFDFAIVDLFLDGDSGDEASNDFIEDHLIPGGVAYGRMSSAPGLVPEEYRGKWVYDKRDFRRDPQGFLKRLADTFD